MKWNVWYKEMYLNKDTDSQDSADVFDRLSEGHRFVVALTYGPSSKKCDTDPQGSVVIYAIRANMSTHMLSIVMDFTDSGIPGVRPGVFTLDFWGSHCFKLPPEMFLDEEAPKDILNI